MTLKHKYRNNLFATRDYKHFRIVKRNGVKEIWYSQRYPSTPTTNPYVHTTAQDIVSIAEGYETLHGVGVNKIVYVPSNLSITHGLEIEYPRELMPNVQASTVIANKNVVMYRNGIDKVIYDYTNDSSYWNGKWLSHTFDHNIFKVVGYGHTTFYRLAVLLENQLIYIIGTSSGLSGVDCNNKWALIQTTDAVDIAIFAEGYWGSEAYGVAYLRSDGTLWFRGYVKPNGSLYINSQNEFIQITGVPKFVEINGYCGTLSAVTASGDLWYIFGSSTTTPYKLDSNVITFNSHYYGISYIKTDGSIWAVGSKWLDLEDTVDGKTPHKQTKFGNSIADPNLLFDYPPIKQTFISTTESSERTFYLKVSFTSTNVTFNGYNFNRNVVNYV